MSTAGPTINDPDFQNPAESALATTGQITPEMLLAADAAFQDNVEREDMRVPRLSICQGTTKEIQEGKEGYKIGAIISTSTREILSTFGPPPWLLAKGVTNPNPVHYLAFALCTRLPNEYLEIIPKSEQKPGELFYRQKSLNKNEDWVKAGIYQNLGGSWGTDKEKHYDPKTNKLLPPPITEVINFLGLPVNLDLKDPNQSSLIESFAIASFSKTSHPCGISITNDVQTRRSKRPPLYAWDSIYFLFTTPKPTPKGTTQIYNMVWGGPTLKLAPELHSMAINMAVQCSGPEGRQLQERLVNGSQITTDMEETTQEGGGGDSDFAGAGAGVGGSEADEAFGDGSKQEF